jgi:hypothetical protein
MSARRFLPAVLIMIAIATTTLAPAASAQRSATCRIQLLMCQYDCARIFPSDPELRALCFAGCMVGFAYCR